MARLNPGRALRSLVPQSRDQRMFLLVTVINIYGTGLIARWGERTRPATPVPQTVETAAETAAVLAVEHANVTGR